jgi:serine/threonine protein kinase/DNA polymerase III delta prime subunit
MSDSELIGKYFGNYRILHLLGNGAFAEVYLAEHRYLEVSAAIKVLHVQMESDSHESFRQEARLIAHLQHPHIVRVLDFGFEGQTPYLVMEYIPKGTLRILHPRGTCLSLEQIVDYVKQIASALDYAHEQHVIHRDVKPENLLLNRKNEIVLSDFGIAVVQHTLASHSAQNMAGTPLYMAPEQIQHHPCPASDQYSLAVIVYEWLCGKPPFPGPGAAVFGQHLYQKPPGLRADRPQLSPAIEDTVFGALAKDPARRFSTVQDFANALEEACFATQILPNSPPIKATVHHTMLSDTLPIPVVSAQHAPASLQESFPLMPHIAGHAQTVLKQHFPVSVMCVCAPADWSYLEQWEAHLRPLEQAGFLIEWSERHLLAGANRQQQINKHLDQADLIVLLLSADFFASEDCMALMEHALRRQQNSAVYVVPLLLRPVAWQASPLVALQYMPSNRLPVTEWPNRDIAFSACIRDLHHLLGLPLTASLRSSPRIPVSSIRDHNRYILLRKVRSFWITGVLEHSLHGVALIALGLQEQPDVIANPWHLVLQHFDMVPRPLPAGMHISDVYDKAAGELLILGAPGSGKTTLLLELARSLLDRAEQDENHPIPVVLTLSSWTMKQLRLVDWLVEELVSKYQVPRKLGQALVDGEQILPLLDGLDEVAPGERKACIKAINTYRQEHGLVSLVVSCRRADYLAEMMRVQLSSAVVIQQLTEQQIDDYLAQGGAPITSLRYVLRQNTELRELACTPLMLSILTLAYYNMPVTELLRPASSAIRLRQVFERYVERMFWRGETDMRYSIGQTIHWLSWLAQRMKRRSQTVFYVERMQPDWSEDRPTLQCHSRVVNGFIFGLIGACCPGPLSGLALAQALHSNSFPILILLCSLLGGLLFGLCNGLLSTQEIVRKLHGKARWSWKHMWKRTVRAVVNGWLVGLLVGLPTGVLLVQEVNTGGIEYITAMVILLWLIGGLVFLLIDVFLHIQTGEIRPAETFAWSWKAMGRNLLKFAGLCVFGCLLIGLLVGGVNDVLEWMSGVKDGVKLLSEGLAFTWMFMLEYAPFIVVIVGLLSMLAGGWSSDVIDERDLTTPNQGIRRSARASLFVGSMGIVLGGVMVGLAGIVTGQIQNLVQLLGTGLIFGLLIGVVSGLRVGGIACIQHMVLCWLLRKADALPMHYVRFLDYAAERVLLRKVGGGYMFVHRLLLDFFASQETSRK